MKTLTVLQPWASLIVAGFKDAENRSWRTKYRGRLRIHAAVRFDQDANEEYGHLLGDDFPLGSLIGSVTLTDCIANSPPHTRGPPGRRGLPCRDPRITPAYAGTRPQLAPLPL